MCRVLRVEPGLDVPCFTGGTWTGCAVFWGWNLDAALKRLTYTQRGINRARSGRRILTCATLTRTDDGDKER